METPSKPGTRYIVHYGFNLSKETFSSWNAAARFIKFCLDNGTRVGEVLKVTP